MQRRLREQRRQEQLERQLAAMQFNGEEFQAIELLDEFLKAEIPLELDPDTELDMWDIPEPLEEPVDLNPEDHRAAGGAARHESKLVSRCRRT
ncbi:hypothetical protein ON010_g13866 [Phytophthora cinnamomi]|nr:hypothetical protein ON010_g13866 [Phytophthora cinnamomi]